MPEEIIKINDNNFKKVITEEREFVYNMDDLLKQEASLMAQLDEVREIIANGRSVDVKTTEELQQEN